jgi:hypothetical protein
MMGHRERLYGGCEFDAFTRGWRKYLVKKAGKFKKIKVRFNRRIRRLEKANDRRREDE